jgi:hypothetical protein
VVPLLFRRRLDEGSTFMAVGEGLAHLHYLIGEGRLRRDLGADGVHRYSQSEPAADAA